MSPSRIKELRKHDENIGRWDIIAPHTSRKNKTFAQLLHFFVAQGDDEDRMQELMQILLDYDL